MPKNISIRNGVYWGRFQVAGRTYRKSLHVRVEPAKRAEAKAIRALERIRKEVEEQVHHGIMAPKLWQEVVILWNDHALKTISDSTHKRYLVSLNQCREWLDNKAIHEIDVACLRDIIKIRGANGASNATIRRDLTAISAILSVAQDEGWIVENPALQINRKRIRERRNPILLPTVPSIAVMLEELPPKLSDICAFALETGMRQDEIVQLEWECVDLDRAVATIHKTKGRKLRAVPLSKAALSILKRQLKTTRSQVVFHRADGSTMDWVSSQFGATGRRLVKQWSQKWSHRGHPFVRFKFHDLRHLFAVRYLRDGGGIYALQGILGHESVKTTEIYLAFLTPDQQHTAKLG